MRVTLSDAVDVAQGNVAPFSYGQRLRRRLVRRMMPSGAPRQSSHVPHTQFRPAALAL